MTQSYTRLNKFSSIKKEKNSEKERFDNFYIPPPEYTQMPNIFVDEILSHLKEGELRVALVIIRETFGWQTNWKNITLQKLENATGMTRMNVSIATKGLLKKGLIEKKQIGPKNRLESVYRMVVGSKKSLSKKVPEYRKDTPQGYRNNTPKPPISRDKTEPLNKGKEIFLRNNTKKPDKPKHTPPSSAIIFHVKIGDTGITEEEYKTLAAEIGKSQLLETLDSMHEWVTEPGTKRKFSRKDILKKIKRWNEKYQRTKKVLKERKEIEDDEKTEVVEHHFKKITDKNLNIITQLKKKKTIVDMFIDQEWFQFWFNGKRYSGYLRDEGINETLLKILGDAL